MLTVDRFDHVSSTRFGTARFGAGQFDGIETRSTMAVSSQIWRHLQASGRRRSAPKRNRDLGAVRRGGVPSGSVSLSDLVFGVSPRLIPGAITTGLATCPAEPLHSKIVHRTIATMADIVPSLKALEAKHVDAQVRGGVIFAWGATDIYDPSSELHRSSEIGVHSVGNYHSIDPGKLTMAPYFADICADRII